ncbi:BTB/POZ domain containing protein [Nitzschia inconspicua]|uniref:BTB/POZ domain containing protein n=1 Tax=Nitzschia inconspicua TaxID=303405 RepID=A0A9K3KX85_9STRA|nr:BTB/POZ domain containing protein [Nitzschia inconspicua]
MLGLSLDNPVVQDLLEALQDEELTDVTLEGYDGVPIPASRFVLAARSSVLKRMLYGNFREANTSRISLEEYDSVILEAIVEYCYRNQISKFRLYIHRTASSARRLVQLYKAADYLALVGLAKLVAQLAHNLTTRYPPLACAVYDEADLFTKVSRDALEMIQSRPYVTLPPDPNTEGGIGCLSSHKLISVYHDQNIQAGELFLFEMLREWKQSMEDEQDHRTNRGAADDDHDRGADDSLSTVQACAALLVLDNIEPHDLLTLVSPSGFCQPESITQAITKQALRAAQTRVWTMGSRGPDLERILVEGAGSKNANGIYYRIDGLANGELYSKREISCGQEFVYTLSISLKSPTSKECSSQEQVECRIFCSKILTHKAVVRLTTRSDNGRAVNTNSAPIRIGETGFQPILQVISLELIPSQEEDSSMGGKQKIQLSDGDHFLYAVMTPRLRSASRNKELAQNTLVKVTEYERCIASSNQEVVGVEKGQMYLHIRKLSIISQDPGHKFCNPVYYYDVCDDESEELSTFSSSSSLDGSREASVIVNPHPSTAIVQKSSIDLLMQPATTRRLFVTESQALQELYFCNYRIRDKPIDSKVPATEWEIDTHGIQPGPKCRWIPAASDSSPDAKDRRKTDASIQSRTSTDVRRPAVASFNDFATSVLPLPLQSKYSLVPN